MPIQNVSVINILVFQNVDRDTPAVTKGSTHIRALPVCLSDTTADRIVCFCFLLSELQQE